MIIKKTASLMLGLSCMAYSTIVSATDIRNIIRISNQSGVAVTVSLQEKNQNSGTSIGFSRTVEPYATQNTYHYPGNYHIDSDGGFWIPWFEEGGFTSSIDPHYIEVKTDMAIYKIAQEDENVIYIRKELSDEFNQQPSTSSGKRNICGDKALGKGEYQLEITSGENVVCPMRLKKLPDESNWGCYL